MNCLLPEVGSMLILISFCEMASCAHISTFVDSVAYEDDRFLGGLPAWVEKYPYMVSVEVKREHVCAGTIISRQHVLTAAHCLHDNESTLVPASSISVRVGSTWDNKEGVMIAVSRYVLNPKYDFNLSGDVGVLALSRKVKRNRKISLASPEESSKLISMTEAGVDCSVVGWGISEPKPFVRHYLQVAHLILLPFNHCQQFFQDEKVFNENDHICSSSNNWYEWPCYLDPGSPLVCQGKQFGVTIFSQRCGEKNTPAIFCRVDNYFDFITNGTRTKKKQTRLINRAHRFDVCLIIYLPHIILCLQNFFILSLSKTTLLT